MHFGVSTQEIVLWSRLWWKKTNNARIMNATSYSQMQEHKHGIYLFSRQINTFNNHQLQSELANICWNKRSRKQWRILSVSICSESKLKPEAGISLVVRYHNILFMHEWLQGSKDLGWKCSERFIEFWFRFLHLLSRFSLACSFGVDFEIEESKL